MKLPSTGFERGLTSQITKKAIMMSTNDNLCLNKQVLIADSIRSVNYKELTIQLHKAQFVGGAKDKSGEPFFKHLFIHLTKLSLRCAWTISNLSRGVAYFTQIRTCILETSYRIFLRIYSLRCPSEMSEMAFPRPHISKFSGGHAPRPP